MWIFLRPVTISFCPAKTCESHARLGIAYISIKLISYCLNDDPNSNMYSNIELSILNVCTTGQLAVPVLYGGFRTYFNGCFIIM